jgi:hypothetical protein
MDKKTAIKAAATSAVVAATLIVAAPAASAAECPAGQEMTTWGCGEVTEHPEQSGMKGMSVISSVTPEVGVDFRNANGKRTGSGLSNKDQFQWTGRTMEGQGRDGLLIEVKQITEDRGGWGPLYMGWIPVKYTQAPGLFS